MIVLPYSDPGRISDRRLSAGAAAEGQLAHYLNRDFAKDESLHVLFGLRIVDPEQPEQDGRPGVCQIDALIIHRHGMFIIESKSVGDAVEVRSDPNGNDEWVRVFRGQRMGFGSPIEQATRQGELLRQFLQRHRTELRGTAPTGLKTITKLVHGSEQYGFLDTPIQVIVAIGDGGRIERKNGWKEPETEFRTDVCKADHVCDEVQKEYDRHARGAGVLSTSLTYGQWSMKPEEFAAVSRFLVVHHTPLAAAARASVSARVETTPERAKAPRARSAPAQRSTGDRAVSPSPSRAAPPSPLPPPSTPARTPVAVPMTAATATDASCRHCGSASLTGKWGRYGYFWACDACAKNTPMPVICAGCGQEGQRGKGVKIRKDGDRFIRACQHCGVEQEFWRQSAAG